MHSAALVLVNFPDFEAVPAKLLVAHGNASARALATADWVLRRKRDGRYLAVATSARIGALRPTDWRQALGRSDEDAVLHRLKRIDPRQVATTLPAGGLATLLAELGIPARYGRERHLEVVAEPSQLSLAGRDRYHRPLWLTTAAAVAWTRMRAAAAGDGIGLDAISGYRSHAYQLGIFRRKRARGIALEAILAVNAAPGYSEHHSGRALDLGTPGELPAEESFEQTPAFAWLQRHAHAFGFRLSYPRGNRHGIAYEPWHWYLQG